MKTKTIILSVFFLLVATGSYADYPRNFVSDQAIAVLSIRDGDSINSLSNTISKQAGVNGKENFLQNYVSLFIENSNAIDFSEEVLLVIEPTVVQEGQRQTGMFGAMPQLVFICKPKTNQKLKLNKSYLNSSILYEGWFLAAGGMNAPQPKTYKKSNILASLKNNQVSLVIEFSELWKKFGSIAQMMGGVMIGGMNKPGPDGLISVETKKAANSARKAFVDLMKTCGDIELITADIGIREFKLQANAKVSTKNHGDISVDNRSMQEMASLLADDMVQYAMSNKMTKILVDYDLSSLQALSGMDSLPLVFTQAMKLLSDLSGDNVVSYGLTKKHGLTIAALTEVEDQREYLASIPDLVDGFKSELFNDASMAFSPTKKSKDSWDINMMSSNADDQQVLDAIFPKGDTLRFRKYGKNRISIALGPSAWDSLTQKHASPLSGIIKQQKNVEIALAVSINAREITRGFIEVSKVAGKGSELNEIKSSPSAKMSLVVGETKKGYIAQASLDLLGLANLYKDIEVARKSPNAAQENGTSSSGGILRSGRTKK